MGNDKVRPYDSPFIGEKFEGYNKQSDNKVGRTDLVVVDIFRRQDDSWFARVSLRSVMRKTMSGDIIGRSSENFDKGTSEHDFLQAIGLMAAALTEHMNANGDMFNLADVVRAAVEYAAFKWRELRGEN